MEREAWCATVLEVTKLGHDWVTKHSSVQYHRSVVPDSLWPHEPQHARPSCPSPIPRVHPNPCPSSRWCHPTISSSVVPFSSCPQSLAESVLPMNAQDWSPLGGDWLDFLAVQGTLKNLLQHHYSKALILRRSAFFTVQLSHPYISTEKTMALTRWTFLVK